MSLLERHRYMITRLAEAFQYPDEVEVEKMMLEPEVLHQINNFFNASGPTKIIFTLESTDTNSASKPSTAIGKQAQPSSPLVDQNGVIVPTHKLRIFIDEMEYVPYSAVYFLKVKKGKEKDEKFAIDPSKINDGTLSFGVIRSPLESLEAVMRCVYKPLLQEMGQDIWGQASAEQKHELLTSVDNFTRGLQESIRSITGGLELKKPDDRLEALGGMAASDPALVTDSLNLLQLWCNKIEKYLDDSDRSRWETADSGPDTELDYWRSRMQRSCLTFH